jgi:hypothetical protein
MPFKRDPKGGGTEADGSRSVKYCSHCYVNGQFTMPNCTAEEMQVLVKGKLKEMGFPGFLASMFVKGIPRLERWTGAPSAK